MNIENAIFDKAASKSSDQRESVKFLPFQQVLHLYLSHLPPRLLVVWVQRGPLLPREHVRRQPRLIGLVGDSDGLRGGGRRSSAAKVLKL